jgi:hypothetical protein
MKKIILLTLLAIIFYSCGGGHRCPTYSDSGAKWKHSGGHPYGGTKHH